MRVTSLALLAAMAIGLGLVALTVGPALQRGFFEIPIFGGSKASVHDARALTKSSDAGTSHLGGRGVRVPVAPTLPGGPRHLDSSSRLSSGEALAAAPAEAHGGPRGATPPGHGDTAVPGSPPVTVPVHPSQSPSVPAPAPNPAPTPVQVVPAPAAPAAEAPSKVHPGKAKGHDKSQSSAPGPGPAEHSPPPKAKPTPPGKPQPGHPPDGKPIPPPGPVAGAPPAPGAPAPGGPPVPPGAVPAPPGQPGAPSPGHGPDPGHGR